MSRNTVRDVARHAKLRGTTTAASYLHRYVYRTPPPWPAFRGASLGITEPSNLANAESMDWQKLDTRPLTLQPVNVPQNASVPELAHGLERVIHGGGLHTVHKMWDRPDEERRKGGMQETRYLRTIIPPEKIDWNRIPKYISARDDMRAHSIAAEAPGVRYATSTSSITPTLAQLYHLLSNFRDTDLVGGLSMRLSELPGTFAKFQRRPIAFELRRSKSHSHVYSINAHESMNRGPRVLLELGNTIERMLTMDADQFLSTFVRQHVSDTVATGDEEQFYHYSVASSLLLRAQIDCRDGNSGNVFDVKTRAIAPIRYNLIDYRKHESHRVKSLRGISNSFEREFYDMVRTVFIKYALQLRIGRMGGALIAYHNTSELLGFEYVPLEEIEAYVYGGSAWADAAFASSIRMLEALLERVHEAFGDTEDVIKVTLATERSRRRMTIYAQRVRANEGDKLGAEEFVRVEDELKQERTRAVDAFQCTEVWHCDVELHNTINRGVAVVGASDVIGGEKVDLNCMKPRSRPLSNSGVYDVNNYELSTLQRGDFYVWHLDVAPLVRGLLAPKGAIHVTDARDFELRYALTQVKDVNDTVKAEYVSDLARMYTM